MPKGVEKTEAEKVAAKAAREKAKAEKFVEIGNKRLPKALDAIALLRALGNTGNYTGTQAQKDYIVKQLEAAVVKVAAALNGSSDSADTIALPTE